MKHILNYKMFEGKESSIMDQYLDSPLFCLRKNNSGSISLDCSIFTDLNLGGYGCGFMGDYFDESDFVKAISKKGDSLRRKLFKKNELDQLIQELGIGDLSKEEGIKRIIDMIKKERSSYASADPDKERKMGLYIEMDEIENLLIKNNK